LETVGRIQLRCREAKGGTGAIDGVIGYNAVRATKIVLENSCTYDGRLECTSSGAGFAGEIESASMTGEIQYINQAKKEVGLMLKAPPPLGFASGMCGIPGSEVPFTIKGAFVGAITPVNKVVSTGSVYGGV
jgi:hypothetical protein